jgi:hypothetical protein
MNQKKGYFSGILGCTDAYPVGLVDDFEKMPRTGI